MEHDRCSEASAIAVTAGHALDALDLGVDRLCASVSGLVSDGVDDAPKVCAHGLAGSFREVMITAQ